MGLAASQSRYLFLTARKADCEYNISIDSMEKMALTREQSELSRQYYAKLQNKTIAYYHDSKYNRMTYQYLMGYKNTGSDLFLGKDTALKEDNSMILTDYNGYVVMNNTYMNAIVSVLGNGCMDANGHGGTFSTENIPAIIASIVGSSIASEEEIKAVINGESFSSSWTGNNVQTLTGNATGNTTTVEGTGKTSNLERIVDFYYPIFLAAANNGWTVEYNNDMSNNDNYISDALVSGTFQLAQVDIDGGYNPDTSLTYFCMEGLVISRTDSDIREEVTAWYNAEKARISEKEDWLDVEIADLSTELEAIKTEMEAVKSFIDDNIESTMNISNG